MEIFPRHFFNFFLLSKISFLTFKFYQKYISIPEITSSSTRLRYQGLSTCLVDDNQIRPRLAQVCLFKGADKQNAQDCQVIDNIT